ncbi:hypothetical protein BDR03DRAFT_957311 [Suillus americanus]|nr:hypothetical protein BDR03DRAFT_957311 [Suillus americanus]
MHFVQISCLPCCTSFVPFCYLMESLWYNSLGLHKYFIHYIYILSSCYYSRIASPFTSCRIKCASQNVL